MQDLIPHLFRTEFRKLTSVITKLFGLEHLEIAEDIVSETFVLAAETWGKKGNPENPTAWLYVVAKNKTKDYLKRNQLFHEKIATDIKATSDEATELELDVSEKNIQDSELQMIFALCHPSIPTESQVGLALRILFGLGIDEIADAFLSNKETINKRLFRAKEKLREINLAIEMPNDEAIDHRLKTVVSTIYLLFSQGYYSTSQNNTLRQDICQQALHLAYLLTQNEKTNRPQVNALIALFCFHASRFEAHIKDGEMLLLSEQDTSLWDKQLIALGENYLNKAAVGDSLSKYHLEAAIAYWHTQTTDSPAKWRQILDYYNILLQIEYSPMAALNRTYALAKAQSVEKGIEEALKLKLDNNYLYFCLLGNLFTEVDKQKATEYYKKALQLAQTERSKAFVQKIIRGLE